jgi:hypothetical protein
MGVGGQLRAPAALPPGKTRYQFYRRLGEPQGRSGRVRKISPPSGRGVKFLWYFFFDKWLLRLERDAIGIKYEVVWALRPVWFRSESLHSTGV